jgi:IS5 family transposase
LHNLGDETVVAQWVQNPYWQFFCGCEDFQWELPCDPSDLVYFRQRIGEDGVAVIFAASAQLHGKKSAEAEVVIDSTVQEPSGARQPAAGSPQGSAGGHWQKAVTYPTDTKLCRRIIARCWKLADRHGCACVGVTRNWCGKACSRNAGGSIPSGARKHAAGCGGCAPSPVA